MKTTLPKMIDSVAGAKAFLKELCRNAEHFHPEDSAFDVPLPDYITYEERETLNTLMDQCFQVSNKKFDPCEYVMGAEALFHKQVVSLEGKRVSAKFGIFSITGNIVTNKRLRKDEFIPETYDPETNSVEFYNEFQPEIESIILSKYQNHV